MAKFTMEMGHLGIKNGPKMAGGRAGGMHARSLLFSPHSLYISHIQNRYPALRGDDRAPSGLTSQMMGPHGALGPPRAQPFRGAGYGKGT